MAGRGLEMVRSCTVATAPNSCVCAYRAPCSCAGVGIQGEGDEVGAAKDVQGLVEKVHTQKGITIAQKTIPGANHFFSDAADILLDECAD